MRLRLKSLSLGLVAAGLLAWQLHAPQDVASPSAAPPAAGSAQAPFVRSMQDTLPDGNLQAILNGTVNGHFSPQAYAELRRLFDYYLSAVGEQSIPVITQQIRSELDRRLPPPQAQKAQRLLDLYIAFKRELVDLEKKPALIGNGVQAIRNRQLAMQELRSRYFSQEETQGMFGFEDAYDTDAIARLEISQNPTLNAVQKQQKLAALDAAMPAVLRNERDASSAVWRANQQAQEMRSKGASEDDIYRMRAKEFDAQAAARLAEVDREEVDWKSRIARYREERSKLLAAQANATESERQSALAQLQQNLFSEAERPRLAAYE
jgi:lipase chaperone LimK